MGFEPMYTRSAGELVTAPTPLQALISALLVQLIKHLQYGRVILVFEFEV